MTGLKVTVQTRKMEWWISSNFLCSAVVAKVCLSLLLPQTDEIKIRETAPWLIYQVFLSMARSLL